MGYKLYKVTRYYAPFPEVYVVAQSKGEALAVVDKKYGKVGKTEVKRIKLDRSRIFIP